jgi:exodeoxyribonuclease VII small subunit
MSTPSFAAQEPTFESAIAELEAIVARMEGGELLLEQSLEDYKRGSELIKFCQAQLSSAQQQVQILEEGMLRPLNNSPMGSSGES